MPPASGMRADRVAAIVLTVIGAFVTLQSRTLPYWIGSAPGPGFVPFWLGLLLTAAALAVFAGTLSPDSRSARDVLPRGAARVRLVVLVSLTAAAALLALVAGLVLASGIFMGVTLGYLRSGRTLANGAIALLTSLVVWLVFVRWLNVPLPAGPLGF